MSIICYLPKCISLMLIKLRICTYLNFFGICQSDQHWNCFKGNTGKTPERQGGAYVGFPNTIDTILN